jgi:hypothetical protein
LFIKLASKYYKQVRGICGVIDDEMDLNTMIGMDGEIHVLKRKIDVCTWATLPWNQVFAPNRVILQDNLINNPNEYNADPADFPAATSQQPPSDALFTPHAPAPAPHATNQAPGALFTPHPVPHAANSRSWFKP